ncbi:MAG: hypothetical protein ACJ71Z_07645 [Aeromicrobium sp.]
MVELSIEATTVAHGVHYALLGFGVVGLLALLGPQLIPGRSAPVDEHALRVRALIEQISAGGPGLAVMPVNDARTGYLPVAIVSSAAAAGVHAAVGPAHFRELAVFGLFFAGAALAQIAWSVAMAIRPSRRLLVAAIVGNGAVLLLWLVTRTLGLPWLLPDPEPVGLLDLCAGAWEVAVVFSAGRMLQRGDQTQLRPPAWPDWEPWARGWALGSAVVLTALTVGVGA